jgi:DNA ligase-1
MIASKQMMEGVDWSGQDPTGWIVMEKFRGCRGEWCGERLWSKSGNFIPAPKWFTVGLPRRARLTGEIFAGNCRVETAARLATQYGHFERGVHRFIVVDAPLARRGILSRINHAARLIDWGATPRPPIEVARADVCTGLGDLIARLETVQAAGGEGLMLYHPSAPWQAGRTANVLKVKSLAALTAALYPTPI